MIRIKTIFILIFLLLLVTSCSGLSQKDAEDSAKDFVNKRVKFFTRAEGDAEDVNDYEFEQVKSYKEGDKWIIDMHVTATLNEETKGKNITIKVNDKGRVIEFNGVEVQ